jgi:hypothetical protein
MNRVLSWPLLPILAQHLEQVARNRHVAVVGDKQAVRITLSFGVIEMPIAPNQQPLLAGTEVYVWFKGGGFLCGPKREIDLAERESRHALRRVKAARAALAASRAERAARLAADIDILLPELDAAIPDNGDSDLAPLDSSPLPLDTAPGQLDEHGGGEHQAAAREPALTSAAATPGTTHH